MAPTDIHPKVAAGAVAGAATTLICWLLALWGKAPTPEAASAMTVLFGLLAGYLKEAPVPKKR